MVFSERNTTINFGAITQPWKHTGEWPKNQHHLGKKKTTIYLIVQIFRFLHLCEGRSVSCMYCDDHFFNDWISDHSYQSIDAVPHSQAGSAVKSPNLSLKQTQKAHRRDAYLNTSRKKIKISSLFNYDQNDNQNQDSQNSGSDFNTEWLKISSCQDNQNEIFWWP